MGDDTEHVGDRYEWNVVLDCAVYPMVYRMERIEEETAVTAAAPQQQQQRQQQPSPSSRCNSTSSTGTA